MTAVATLAAAEFKRRQVIAQQARDVGRWTVGQATEALRPWLAVAAAAGADLPELFDEQRVIFPPARRGQTITVRISSGEICPRERWHSELTRARDTALAKVDDEASARKARDLTTIANALGVTSPYHATAEAASLPIEKEAG